MPAVFRHLELRFPANWYWQGVFIGMLLGLMLLGKASSAQASIHFSTPFASDDALEVLAQNEHDPFGASSSAGAGSHSSQPSDHRHAPTDGSESESNMPALPTASQGPPSGSTSSSSSTSTGSTSAGGMSFLATASVSLPDLSPTSRIAVERSLILPEVIGMDLLRPPQTV